eukprot:442293_1
MLALFCLSLVTVISSTYLKCDKTDCGASAQLAAKCGVCAASPELVSADPGWHCSLALGMPRRTLTKSTREEIRPSGAQSCNGNDEGFICAVTIDCKAAGIYVHTPFGSHVAEMAANDWFGMLEKGKGKVYEGKGHQKYKREQDGSITKLDKNGKDWKPVEKKRKGMVLLTLMPVFTNIKHKAKATNVKDFTYPEPPKQRSLSLGSDTSSTESDSSQNGLATSAFYKAHTGLQNYNYEYDDDRQSVNYPIASIQMVFIVFVACIIVSLICLFVCIGSFVCGWIAKTVISNRAHGFKYDQISQDQQSEVV